MKILVTGGAGYLGSVLVPRLTAAGHEVTVLDDHRYGTGTADDMYFIFDNVLNERVVQFSARDQDAVIHLAAMRLEECEANPADAFRVNTEGTRNVLMAAEAAGVRRLIFASTCSNYGITEGIATEDTPLAPTTIYAMTKTYAEEFVKASPIGIVLRFGTLYGPSPNIRYDTLINALAREIATGGSFELRDPDSWRPFLHVEDAADAIMKMLTYQPGPESGILPIPAGVYNVIGYNITKRQLHDLVRDQYPSFDIRMAEGKDARSYRVRGRYFDWLPQYTVASSLPELVEHIREVENEKETR